MSGNRKIRLGTFLTPHGEHIAAWRTHPSSGQGGAVFDAYIDAAKIAEDAYFDFVFLGDVSPNENEPMQSLARYDWYDRPDPLTIMPAIASATRHIGLVATASTTYNDPFTLARRLATLDHISHGRAGWNLVTTMNHSDAQNFGLAAHPSARERYERAEEFAEVAKGLWDCWDDDAFIRDTQTGMYFDPAKSRRLNHTGKYFQVRGPLAMPRSPQGHPVIVQAGSSEDGKSIAAAIADVVFVSQQSLTGAKTVYADMKARVAKAGRDPRATHVLAGLMPVVGPTDADAHHRYEEIQNLLDPNAALSILSALIGGNDLSIYDPNAPVPDDFPAPVGMSSLRESLLKVARTEKLTLLQLAKKIAGSRGHHVVIGSPETIADKMQEWFEGEACDGFLLLPAATPAGLRDFADMVVPVLQQRGLFRQGYEGNTLRDRLGLARPTNILRH